MVLLSVVFILTLLPHLEPTSGVNTNACDGTGYYYEQSVDICFKFNTHTKNKTEADITCEEDGGYLIMLDTTEKHNYLTNYIKIHFGGYPSFWIGLSDEHSEGNWTWSNGKPQSGGGGWAVGQPKIFDAIATSDKKNNVDCASIWSAKWFDDNCDKKNSFICEVN